MKTNDPLRWNTMSHATVSSVTMVIALANIGWLGFDSRSPVNWHRFTLISERISNYIHCKVWDDITYPFLNFNDATEFGKDKEYHPTLYFVCDYLFMVTLNLISVCTSGPSQLITNNWGSIIFILGGIMIKFNLTEHSWQSYTVTHTSPPPPPPPHNVDLSACCRLFKDKREILRNSYIVAHAKTDLPTVHWISTDEEYIWKERKYHIITNITFM